MGIAVARTGYGFYWEDLQFAAAFALGAIAMRGAGCTYNDILDRDIDAKVERTRLRPLPSGAVTLKQAWVWLLAQCGVGLIALLMLPPLAQIVCVLALPPVAMYPLMKRITWWPQAWLGFVFSWGALAGGAASAPWNSASYAEAATSLFEGVPLGGPGGIPVETIALYAGCVAWVIAYDTIYALQDREDDALVGVRSTARLFGDKWRIWTSVFYVAALSLWAAAGAIAGAGFWVAAPLSLIGALLIWPMFAGIDDKRPETALTGFKFNAVIGAAVLLAFAIEPIWRTIRPALGV